MKIYKVTSEQYTSLINTGSITVNGVVYTYDPNSLYSIVDQTQDEYTLVYDKTSSHLWLNKNGDIHSDIKCEDMLVGHAKDADYAASLRYGSDFLTANSIQNDLNNKLDKVTNTNGLHAYTTTTNGVQSILSITDIPAVGFIPKYNNNKSVTVALTPVANTDAVSKAYIDNKLASYATTSDLNNKYTKPADGIPKADLDSAVQTSLGKADTALQAHQAVTLATGTNNGTVKLTVGNTITDNIAVKGLKSGAYKEVTTYLDYSSTHNTLTTSKGIYNYLEKDFRKASNLKYRVTLNRKNKLSCLPPQCVIIEKSMDAGQTWEDAGFTDEQKRRLFSDVDAPINMPQKNGKQSIDCMLRITISTNLYKVPNGTPETEKYNYWNPTYWDRVERYFTFNFLYVWCKSADNFLDVKVYKALGSAPNNWILMDQLCVKNWPGSASFNTSETSLGAYATAVNQPWSIRFVFRTASGRDNQLHGLFEADKLKDATNNQTVYLIKAYGDNDYGGSYLSSDHIGLVDENYNLKLYKVNVIYPNTTNSTSLGWNNAQFAGVYASKYYENGTLISNKYLSKVTTADSTKLYMKNADGTQGMIALSQSASGNSVVHRDINGKAQVATPTDADNKLTIVNKQYVDDSISTALQSYIKSITLNGSTLTPTNNTINLGNLALATHTHHSADITDSIPLVAGSNISLTPSVDGITIAATSQTGNCFKFDGASGSYGGYISTTIAKVSPPLPVFFQKGVIIDSFSNNPSLPGLMVQHISGITNSANHEQGSLYFNYDGDAKYARPVILGSGNYGSAITKTTTTSTEPTSLMGTTHSAIRGDQMVNYVQACLPNITLSTNGSAATKQENIAFSLNGTELTITVS